jgi:peptide/nickel transport system ATP-binding protein
MRGNEVAMIFQDSQSSLNPTKTIGKQVAEPVRLHRGASKREARDRALEVLELVGMPQPRERLERLPPPALRRAAPARDDRDRAGLRAAVLIADEPTTALDVTIQAQILLAARRPQGAPRHGDAAGHPRHGRRRRAHLDRINVMYAGRIVETARDRPSSSQAMRHPYTQALLGSIPRLSRTTTKALVTMPGLPPDLTRPPTGCRFAPRCPRATAKCIGEEPPLTGEDPATCSPAGTRSTGRSCTSRRVVAERSARLDVRA